MHFTTNYLDAFQSWVTMYTQKNHKLDVNTYYLELKCPNLIVKLPFVRTQDQNLQGWNRLQMFKLSY